MMQTPAAERKQTTKQEAKASKTLAPFIKIIEDAFSLVMRAQEGVPASVAFSIADTMNMHPEELADILHTTTKTLRTYRQESKKLNATTSEQALKLLAMQMKGEQVFGDANAFRRWLQKPAYGLKDQIPFNLLKTSGGIDLVVEELDRIAHGDLA